MEPKQKHQKKNKPKFNIQLSDEQKAAKKIMLTSPVTIITGRAGSGKSLLACQHGYDFFLRGKCSRLLLARPAVEAGENLGFLPGDLADKLDPYLEPLKENLSLLSSEEDIEEKIKSGDIKIFPLAFARGRTLCKEILIVDEAQNMTISQMTLILGRLGKGSQIIFTGDTQQTDIKQRGKMNALDALKQLSESVDGVNYIELKENYRHELVVEMLEFCENLKHQ